jgi:exosortase/archaeosortase family protein
LYSLILRPPRILDRPLTNFITSVVTKAINLTEGNQDLSWKEDIANGGRNYLLKNNEKVFGIYDVCNGIDLMFIYIGIIVLLPSTVKRKLLFSLAGIVAIIIANIIRVYALYFIYFHYRPAFEISHHYIFTLLIYALIFYGWLLFVKNKQYEKGN